MISRYLSELESALKHQGPNLFYFPHDKQRRKEVNKRLGREIGYGLAIFSDWEDYAGTFYGRFIVMNSFDTTGVVISNKEWLNEIKKGVDQYYKDK